MNAEQYIKTEYFNNTGYRLRKEFDGSLTLNEIYSPYSEWSNCTDIEYNIRLTPKRLYISMYYFSDLSGQQKTHSNKIYVNRNNQIDIVFNHAMDISDNIDDIELHAELKNLFNFFNDIYHKNNNGA